MMDTLSAIPRKAKQWGYVCEGVDLDAWSNAGSMAPTKRMIFRN